MDVLENKVVVITGGSKGLGLALAKSFVSRQAKVIIFAKKDKSLKTVAKDIRVDYNLADVTDEASVIKAGQRIVKKYGKIDIWVNNAGIWLPHAPIEDMNLKRVHDMVEVNLFGTIYGSKFAMQQMRQQGGGAIVNILSTSALAGRAYSSGYCASKYAAVGFTNSLRLEVADDNIKVISIYPGGMQTNFFDEAKPENYSEYMDPNEVAEKIVSNLSLPQPLEEQIIKRQA